MSTAADPAKKAKVAHGHAAACLEIADVCKLILTYCATEAAVRLSDVVLRHPATRSITDDDALWASLVLAHFGSRRHFPPAAPCPPGSVPCPSATFAPSPACVEFCETSVELALFDALQVLQGDIQTIAAIDERPIDCLVFPTNSSLLNAGSGASAAVFRRAGPALDAHVAGLQYDGYESAAVITPGFAAGVAHLVHCVGPSHMRMNANALLYNTYINAFEQCRRQGAACVAVASISTGNLGFPLHVATMLAMRAFRDFVKTHRWTATVAFVCYDNRVATFMRTAKSEVAQHFNDHCFQVMAIV
ncbi:hypothetical protein ACHHYP_09965 [Achlya hypogyna]|uniref:Macro domain-containing protein n=1 Tax=Achlya hypogyna TaxID=1202772 RepID=A0A1V9YM48_ACHHY|nr:hypothetical protein ACHHYP_09965 [Achlya hypogyna]